MKKLIGLFLLVLVVVSLASCKKDEVVAEYTVLGLTHFTVEEISSVQLERNRPIVYTYKYQIGVDALEQPIYTMVASADVYEIGDQFDVLRIYLDLGFDYSVIMFEDYTLDTSWHTYLDRVLPTDVADFV